MIRFSVVALFATLALAPVPAFPQSPESESIRMRDLRLGTTPEAQPATTVFPGGTKTIYARFHYEDGASERVTLVITGRSGIQVLRVSEQYRGTGDATVPITGADIYRTLTQTLDEAVRAGQSNAQEAARQSIGVREYLMATQSEITRMEQSLDLLMQVRLGEPQAGQREAVRAATVELGGLIKEALAVSPDNVARMQALAARMASPFRAAVLSAGPLTQTAGQVRDVSIPGAGVDDPQGPSRNAYTLNVEVSGSPTASVEFWVQRAPVRVDIYLPSLRKHEP